MYKERENAEEQEELYWLWQHPEEVESLADAIEVIGVIWDFNPPIEGRREMRENRIRAIKEFRSRLPEEIRRALIAPGKEGLSPLQKVQREKSRPSRGSRLNIRRRKALERRSTPPDRIH